MKTQDLIPGEDGLFRNDYGDVFQHDAAQDIYYIIKKEASEPMRSVMRRLEEQHPDWPESRVQEHAKIITSTPIKNKKIA